MDGDCHRRSFRLAADRAEIMTGRIRKSADKRKAEIVTAALKLAGEVGPDRITTQALAEAVGISQPGIFRHFPKKEDIWGAVAQHIAKRLRENWSGTINEDKPPADRLQAFVFGHLTFLQRTPAIPAILFSRELHAENEPLRTYFAGLMKRAHQRVRALVADEIEAGNFDAGLNPDDAAYLVLALIQGTAMRWSLNARNFDLAEEGARLLAVQLAGYRRS